MLTTGMRPGEALGLKWGCIIEEDKIHMQRSLVTRGKGWSLTEPKTSRSRRTISIPASVVRVLQKHKMIENQERRLKEAGLPETIRLYDLRHT